MGESWFHVCNHFFKVAAIEPNIDKFNVEFREIYQELLLKELLPSPNVKELLVKLKAKGKRLGVVSSAAPWMVEQILSQLNLAEFFEIVITQEHVKKHKPDPEAYLLALKMLSLSGSDVLVFEDSNAGLVAAGKANCDTVAFRHEFNVNNDFGAAIQVIADFAEIILNK